MNLFEGQEPHVKILADRTLDLFKTAVQAAKGDKDVALLYMCGFLTHARDYLIEKTGMHPNTAERDMQEHSEKHGFRLAVDLLVADYERWKTAKADPKPESNLVIVPG